jgi:hypothetical protein
MAARGVRRENGLFTSKGKMRPAVETLREYRERAERARSRLGFDPISRASLNVDQARAAEIAFDLAKKDLEEGSRPRKAVPPCNRSMGIVRLGITRVRLENSPIPAAASSRPRVVVASPPASVELSRVAIRSRADG